MATSEPPFWIWFVGIPLGMIIFLLCLVVWKFVNITLLKDKIPSFCYWNKNTALKEEDCLELVETEEI
uniref:Uncharacterized protein n=1 Tax=Abalone asfa-like virus TaxID=2839893 RepID=A0A5K7XY19_9VIRU|nr:hypothetical protein [Abalone asfa-like virus]